MNPAKIGFAELVSRLRASASSQDAPVQAAVELLVEHEFWLRNAAFVGTFVTYAHGATFVDWYDVQAALDAKARALMVASSSELAILRLGVLLVRDPLGLSSLGSANAALAARTFAAALGVNR
jgi:hypothetical protein